MRQEQPRLRWEGPDAFLRQVALPCQVGVVDALKKISHSIADDGQRHAERV